MGMIEGIINKPNRKQTDLENLQKTDTPIYMYGAGSYAKDVTVFLNRHSVDIKGYCVDRKYLQKGQNFLNKNIDSIENIYDNQDDFIIVIGFNDYVRARESLSLLQKKPDTYFFDAPHQLNFFDYNYIREHKDKFQQTYDWLEDDTSKEIFTAFVNSKISGDPTPLYKFANFNQYFSEPIKLTNEEIFVDCGAYDGDTVKSLLKNTQNKYKKIYAFEPDTVNYKKLKDYLKTDKINNVVAINKGTWSEETELNFSSDGNMASIVEGSGNFKIQVQTIDNIIANDGVTFIKMDIEGAELESLKGAKQTILNSKPTLAICVYHKPDDLIDIPQYIKSLNGQYKLYLRQHQLISWETVLYALPN